MEQFIRLALGGVVVSAISLVAVDSAHAYDPGDQMCSTWAEGDESGVLARCMDSSVQPIAAIGVRNYDDGSEITFGVWNRISDKDETCNGTVVCYAEVGPDVLQQSQLPRWETTVRRENFGIPLKIISLFYCMCE
jgi:hypothetical protein